MMKYKTCTDYWLDTERMTIRGEFEAMYQEVDDPWGCCAARSSLNNKIFLELIFDNQRYQRILDIGCGLGGFTKHLFDWNGGGSVTGCDISATAVQMATKHYPDISFVVKNIMHDDFDDLLPSFDLIIISEVLWYILDNIDEVFQRAISVLAPSGVLAIHQYFPDEQKFGTKVISGLDGFEEFIEKRTVLQIQKKIVSYGETEGKVLLSTLERRA